MRARRLVSLVLALMLASALPALAWGPGAHAVIMSGVAKEKPVVFSSGLLGLQAVYGATAPDFAWLAPEPLRFVLGNATHNDPGYLRPWRFARTPAQRSFAFGWLTHNQAWGADRYAHLQDPFPRLILVILPGYVVERAGRLVALQGISEEAAHDYIEVAIDLLLDQENPTLRLGNLLTAAAASRDRQIPDLLARSYAGVPGGGWFAILTLEASFRAGLRAYGRTLALPTGDDDAVFAKSLALRHGLTPEQSAACLADAKKLCEPTYADAIGYTTKLVADGPWPPRPATTSVIR